MRVEGKAQAVAGHVGREAALRARQGPLREVGGDVHAETIAGFVDTARRAAVRDADLETDADLVHVAALGEHDRAVQVARRIGQAEVAAAVVAARSDHRGVAEEAEAGRPTRVERVGGPDRRAEHERYRGRVRREGIGDYRLVAHALHGDLVVDADPEVEGPRELDGLVARQQRRRLDRQDIAAHDADLIVGERRGARGRHGFAEGDPQQVGVTAGLHREHGRRGDIRRDCDNGVGADQLARRVGDDRLDLLAVERGRRAGDPEEGEVLSRDRAAVLFPGERRGLGGDDVQLEQQFVAFRHGHTAGQVAGVEPAGIEGRGLGEVARAEEGIDRELCQMEGGDDLLHPVGPLPTDLDVASAGALLVEDLEIILLAPHQVHRTGQPLVLPGAAEERRAALGLEGDLALVGGGMVGAQQQRRVVIAGNVEEVGPGGRRLEVAPDEGAIVVARVVLALQTGAQRDPRQRGEVVQLLPERGRIREPGAVGESGETDPDTRHRGGGGDAVIIEAGDRTGAGRLQEGQAGQRRGGQEAAEKQGFHRKSRQVGRAGPRGAVHQGDLDRAADQLESRSQEGNCTSDL